MTEAEWLACTDPQKMLGFLREKASNRKLRLFACLCARNVLPLLSGDLYTTGAMVVKVGEDHADGLVGPAAILALRDRFRSIPGDFQWAALSVSNP